MPVDEEWLFANEIVAMSTPHRYPLRNCPKGVRAKWDDSFATALAPHNQGLPSFVDVVHIDPDQFTYSDAG